MNLVDFKNALTIGRKIRLINRFGKEMNDLREVEKVQSNSVKFKGLNGSKAGWLEFPKSSLIDFDGKTAKIYQAGLRELTEEEKRIRDDEPKDDEQDRIDMLSDGSTMFYRRKKYYKDVGYEYLFTSSKKIQGKYLTYKDGKHMIQDDKIKGEINLIYDFE